MNWRRIFSNRWVTTLLIVAAVLIGIRAALPGVIRHYVNKTLDEIPEYDGRIGDIDLHIIRGAYQIQDVELVKTTGDVPVPFFSARSVDLSVEWGALFRGALVGEIAFDEPKLNFVAGPNDEKSQKSMDNVWLEKVRELFPLRINRFEVVNGEIHFHDFHSEPRVNIYVNRIFAVASNLTNSRNLSQTLVAIIDARGKAMDEAGVRLYATVDPYARQPTFNVDASITEMNLTSINDYLRAYGKFDAEGGTFSLFGEFAATDGKISGYVKPIFNDVDIVNWKENTKTPLKLIWEAVVGAVGRIFTNPPANRVATKIPIEGTIDDPDVDLFAVIGGVLQNAFIRAFLPGIEGSINLKDAKEAD